LKTGLISNGLSLGESSYAHVTDYLEAASEAARYPNRHALLHGHASFSTIKDSVNTLFIADFMFHGIRALEALRQQGLFEADKVEVARTESNEDVRRVVARRAD
jgi:hypothetical protein